MKIKVFASLVALALLCGCAKQRITKSYFDAVLSEHVPYELPGISGFEIRAYQIVQTTDDLVVVRVTYATKAGLDRVDTKKFRVADGRLYALDRADIEAELEAKRKLEADKAAAILQVAAAKQAEKDAAIEAEKERVAQAERTARMAVEAEKERIDEEARKARIAKALAEKRIEAGMTRTDVSSLLGEPAARRGNSPDEAWIYRDGTVVEFSEQYVSSFTDHRPQLR